MSKKQKNLDLASELVRIQGVLSMFTYSEDFLNAMQYQASLPTGSQNRPLVDEWVKKEAAIQRLGLDMVLARPGGKEEMAALKKQIRSLFFTQNRERGRGVWALPRLHRRMRLPDAGSFIQMMIDAGWVGPIGEEALIAEANMMAYKAKVLITTIT